MKRIIALLLVIVFVLSLAGCAQGEPERIASRRDLPEEDPQNPGSSSGVKPDEKPMDAASAKAYNAFAFKMFQEVYAQREDTVMVSPYSLYIALCLLTNGADGDTLSVMREWAEESAKKPGFRGGIIHCCIALSTALPE